jgi:hypothetical protein
VLGAAALLAHAAPAECAPARPATPADGGELPLDARETGDDPALRAGGPRDPALRRSRLQIEGSARLGSSINYAHHAPRRDRADYRGVSRLRPELKLAGELELSPAARARASGQAFHDFAYTLKGRREFTRDVLRVYESEVALDEAWLALSPLPDVDVKVGRQIASFGPADLLRVVDVLSPVDNREPGLIELEDRRLPAAMTRVDYFAGALRATGIAIHESRFDRQPVHGSDFYPPDGGPLPERKRANGGSDTEYGLVIGDTFGSTDVALYFARYFERSPHLAPPGVLDHSRLTLLGASATAALGAWVLKAEAAHVQGLRSFREPHAKRARSDALLGFEYSGFTDTELSVEIALRHLHDFEHALALAPDRARRDSVELSLRLARSLRNDRVRLLCLGTAFGARAEDGLALRLSVAFVPRDAFTLELGTLIFRAGKRPPFRYFGDNDRLFLAVEYDF